MTQTEVVLCHPRRTAVGRFGGTLKSVPATTLGATVLRTVLEQSDLEENQVDGVVMGHVITAGAGMNTARQAALNGGLPESVPAMTVNRVCGSGAQAIATAAQEIRLGQAHCMIAGGMENMDQGPYLLDRARWGYRMGPGTLADATLRDGLNDAFSGEHSGWHTEDLVEEHQISRQAQDAWAARSQQRFAKAQEEGRFDAEIVPVKIEGKSGETDFDTDEANRADATEEGLSKLRPAFRKDGTITAGNAPGLNSAASAMIVASRGFAEDNGLEVAARLIATGSATGAGARGLVNGGYRAGRDQRGFRRHRHRPDTRARAVRGHREYRGRGHSTRPSDRCHRHHPDHAPAAFDGTRRVEPGARHALHRRRSGDRAVAGTR